MDPAPPNLLWVAGEISGDHHAGAVAAEVRRRAPHLTGWGLGGPDLRAAGVDTLHDVNELAVMGLGEVLRRYGFFRQVMRTLVAEARRRRPVAAILVDYPGFNLRLARELKKLDIPVIYYVCPQVWAWRRGRMRTMAQWIKHLLVIFPFEVELFQGTGLPVTYVGHPLVAPARAARAAPPVVLPWGDHPRIALLPGSRRQELERLLPSMLAAAQGLEKTHGGSYLIAAPNAALAAYAGQLLAATPHKPAAIAIVTGQTRPLLCQARAAWVTSGTATLEAALLRCPQVVVYRTSLLTYALAKCLVHVPHIGMVNLVAQRTLCPELVQHHATPNRLAAALRPLCADGPARAAQLAGFDELEACLGAEDPAPHAAGVILASIRA